MAGGLIDELATLRLCAKRAKHLLFCMNACTEEQKRLLQDWKGQNWVKMTLLKGKYIMAFRSDGHGFAFSCYDLKITGASSTWGMKLSQLEKQKGTVRVITHGLPTVDYVQRKILDKHPQDVFIIVDSEFRKQAQQIKNSHPDVRVAVHEKVHSSVVLVEPDTVYISNADFGFNDDNEFYTSIGLHSTTAHMHMLRRFNALWETSTELSQHFAVDLESKQSL